MVFIAGQGIKTRYWIIFFQGQKDLLESKRLPAIYDQGENIKK
jgi:hypothetical protein